MANPSWPIIYVRGYAMTQGEIDDTTADPFCGFNIGSTVYRATTDRNAPRKFIFESPVLRLAADHGYATVFDGGLDIIDEGFGKTCIPPKSIVIYRYYDEASRVLGTGVKPDIRKFGEDLGKLIARVRDLVCKGPDGIQPADFRCYLVAHSMGGLVCRTFLQSPKTPAHLLAAVDKVFTYATPHNGIEMAGVNVPSWLGKNEINTFARENMATYLNLKDFFDGRKKDRVDLLPQGPGRFSADRFFCMVGTNRNDYEAGAGLSRTFTGNGSDGLVRIANATLSGIDDHGALTPCPTAYTYRSHSGYYGIVNSEEAYQNLVRFLFGDVRVDVWLDVASVTLPREIEERAKDKDVDALYQFEVLASLRECRWFLTRRVAEEDSVACRTYKQLTSGSAADRSVYLSSIFMTTKAREGKALKSLAYALTLGVRVPDYEVDHKLWVNEHFEGGYIFRDTSSMELFPARGEKDEWNVVQSWGSQSGGRATIAPVQPKHLGGEKMELTIPFAKQDSPGISGQLRFVASAWK